MGTLVGRLGRFRDRIAVHLEEDPNPDRSLRALLFMGGLYHDIGKPRSREIDESGRIRFNEHPRIGAEILERRARQLCLGNREVDRLRRIVAHHMRPLFLAHEDHPPSRRAIYRFFRDTAEAGVDICLLSLADVLATYGPTLGQEAWLNHLDTVRILLDAWWDERETVIDPTPLLNGTDLMEELDLQPGPALGQLLETLRESRASGQIDTRADALEFARQWLADQDQG
jgi:putative nucleotidyltransferase with HDIG domain